VPARQNLVRTEEGRRDLLGADVGKRIRKARLEHEMSLAQLGGEDLSRSFLSLVESGRSRISLRALAIVAERLDMPMSYFLEDTDADKASELVVDQAEAALARYQPEEALKILNRGRVTTALSPRAAWIRGSSLEETGAAREAIPVLREGLKLSEKRGDSVLTSELLYALGSALYATENYDEALTYLRRGMDSVQSDEENPMLVGKLSLQIGNIQYVKGETEQAIAEYERARELFGSIYDLDNVGSVAAALSQSYYKRGDLAVALHYSKQSLASFRLKHDARQVAGELNNIAMRYRSLGDLDQALESATESVARAQEVDAQDLEALARSTLASINVEREEFDLAESQALMAIDLSSSDADLSRVDAWIVLARVYESKGQGDQVDHYFRKALNSLRENGNTGRLADAALAYSLSLKTRGQMDAALEFALESAKVMSARPA
jgi:HTH-type transcriptional regulator, quorum sensing regulator NprR